MVGSILLRGMLVGILAGLVAFGFARLYGEPQVALAIAFEEASGGHSHGDAAAKPAEHTHGDHAHGTTDAAAPHDHDGGAEEEVFSRATQAGPGLLVALVVYGAAMGGLFALAFAFVNGRAGALSPRATAGLLALGAFVALVLVPGLKYPANPPAVGDAATIGLRTRLFFMMLAASVAGLVAAVALARRLAARGGAWNGTLIAALCYIAFLGIVMALLPGIDEVPEGFSASLLWQFRLSSLGMQAVLWSVIGIAFGAWMEQASHASPARRALAG